MEFNLWVVPVAAISALLVGFVWYHPKVFGTAWMKAADMTDEKIKGGNMLKIFGLAFLFALMLAFTLPTIVIHQSGAASMIGGFNEIENAKESYTAFMNDYGTAFRTFKHGVLHGVLAGIFIVLPVLGTNALFERKGAKYIFINSGYWMVTLGLMGGIICAWL